MRIMAVDTSGPVAGVAVYEDGAVVCELMRNDGLKHSQTIMPMIDEAFEWMGARPEDIDIFAAVAGPGSFTGVRIGVCAVKGLAHAAGKPVIGVNSLETLAMNAYGFGGVICPILDARRDQVYCAAFRFSESHAPIRVMDDAAMDIDELLSMMESALPVYFLGDGLARHSGSISKRFGKEAVLAPACSSFIRVSAVAALAAQRREQAIPCGELEPIYLRRPQAERELEERGRA